MGDVVDVDPAGGDVSGHQHVDLALAEGLERLLAGDLTEVAVHRADLEAALGELVGDLLRGALGAGEDHGGAPALRLQDAGDHLDLVQRVGAVDELLGGVVGGRGLGRLGADVGRLVHEGAGQRDDRVGHGRREQHRLAGVRGAGQDALDIGQEAQVEHFVGLVKDQHREPAELQVVLLGEVEQATRGADDDVGTGLQGLDLGLVGASAVDGDHRERTYRARLAAAGLQELGGADQVVIDLQAQLAGGHHHECAGGAVQLRLTGTGDAVQQGDPEGEGLPHAGAGLADQVVAGQGQRKGELLNREGVLDALFGEGLDDLLANPELGETGLVVGMQMRHEFSFVVVSSCLLPRAHE